MALLDRLRLLERLSAERKPPPWLVRPPTRKTHTGIATLLISDTHFDEVVEPEQVEGANAYNRRIAIRRLERVLAKTVNLVRVYLTGIRYEGCVLMLGGDLLSGALFEELEETNEDTVYGSLDFWADQLAGFVLGLKREFPRLHLVAVVGNHGRRTRRPRAKGRVRDNLDWLLYRLVAKATQRAGVTWEIPESADVDVKIYSTRYRLTHGDQFRGGSGISGLMAPLLLGQHRKAQRQMSLDKPFDWIVMGHWHEYLHGRGLIVNGSLKGYDEWGYVNNYKYEKPSQAFWVTTPEHGATFAAPIFGDDR